MGSSTLHNPNRTSLNSPAWPPDVERSIRDSLNRVSGNCELLKLDTESHPVLASCFDRIRKGVMAVFQEAQGAHASGNTPLQSSIRLESVLDQVTKTMEEAQSLVRTAPELHLEDDLLELEFSLYHFSREVRHSIAQSGGQPETGTGQANARDVVGQSPVILVADDDDSNRDLLARLLRIEKYDVVFAIDGREVLEKLAAENIDLILLDLVMPGASGFEVLRSARATDAGKELPIVMISGVDETEKVAACLESGADDYVLKPFNATLLRARVRILLDRKQARDLERQKAEELKTAIVQLDNERKLAEQLLLNILPKSASEELRTRGAVSPTYFEDVTVVFTDFVSFTASTEKLTTDELVNALNDYFTAFDSIVDRYGLEKLKTVGDSYIFLSGLPERTPSHPIDAVLASIEMLQYVKSRQESGVTPAWSMRVGIHTGPVIAGVVGTRKFAFDVWGDSVNLASRMVSSGAANRINVSERAFQRCKDFFQGTHRGMVEIKGNRKAEMYFVDGVIPALLEGDSDGGAPSPFEERYARYFHRKTRAFPSGLRSTVAPEAGSKNSADVPSQTL